MTIIKNGQLILQKLKQINKLQIDMINYIVKTLEETEDIEGLTRLSSNIIIVPFSKLNTQDWSAEHYLTNKQIDNIVRKVKELNDVNKIFKFIKDSLEKGYIEIIIYQNRWKACYKIKFNYRVKDTLQKLYDEFILTGFNV